MPESTPRTGRLKVRSDTLVGLTPQASIVTAPGTADQMPRAQASTADTMPRTQPADQSPLDRGDRVVSSSSHYSWKALQDTDVDHRPMAGAVSKNKAPF